MDNCSVVIDNTNRNKATRAPYISLAKELNVNIRCIYFDVPHELCVHNSLYRVRSGLVSHLESSSSDDFFLTLFPLSPSFQQAPEEERKVLPEIAFLSYFKNVEVPTKEEGFDSDIVTVKMSFRGDEEAKRRWLMYWQ
jgi:bifunctional polynucleotide phosphatase/kinase